MNVTITPARLRGTVTPPPSKSQAHRVVLALALSGGEGKLGCLSASEDIRATEDCVAALKNGTPAGLDGLPLLDCRESGSTLRFLIPAALALRGGGCFLGRGRLMERPLTPYFDIFREKGVFWERAGNLLEVKGTLPPGEYRLPGDVSSQFVTGLLYALPLLDGDSELVLTSPLESRGYVDMTLDVLGKFGVRSEARENGFFIPGNQVFRAGDLRIEADWSQAGFWYAAAFLGNPVKAAGMDPGSAQGDRVIAAHFELLSQPGDAELDVSGCPDLVPPLAAMAALRAGQATRLTNAARLRIKESDRLAAVTRVLSSLGADVTEGADFLAIRGKETLAGGAAVSSFNDHRIAMMAAVAATRCEKPVTITGAECVAKSYPAFWDDYEALGGKLQKEKA